MGYSNVAETNVDLMSLHATLEMFRDIKPAYVFHLAAYVRGIAGNMRSQSLSFLRNTTINTNVIEACRDSGVKKIVAMGTVAMYPDKQVGCFYSEDDIWNGEPHSSEYGYGHAKRGMYAQLQAYRKDYGLEYVCAISTNLYGPHDRFDIENGHVIPSLIRKFHEARRSEVPVTIWGDGSATRDFLYVKDAARALVMMMDLGDGAMNLATGDSYTILQAAKAIGAHAGYDRVEWDTSKPVGQRHRKYDVSRLTRMGFSPEYSLSRGLRETYDWYSGNELRARR